MIAAELQERAIFATARAGVHVVPAQQSRLEKRGKVAGESPALAGVTQTALGGSEALP